MESIIYKASSKKNAKEKKVIGVVGLGYVGLPLALLADRKGYRVIAADIDGEKIERLRRKESPFLDDDIAKRLGRSHLEATTDFARLKEASIIVICVPTPVNEDRTPDFGPVRSACKSIGRVLQKNQLVVLESTVNPGVCESIALPILEEMSGLKGGVDFDLAHCPERINPGDKEWSVENIPRVVGGLTPQSAKQAISFYRSIVKGEVKPMGSLKEAEAVKIVENTFRDVNIAFVNELAISFSRLGIDVTRVIQGASTKPFGFMPFYPGSGVGGHCIPVDPYYLIEYAKVNGFNHRFLTLAREINEDMPKFIVEQLEKSLEKQFASLEETEIALLGLAYKPEIDDYRESPSFEIARLLTEKGASVRTYDPYIRSQSTVGTLKDALRNANAAIIATAHDVFRTMRPHDFIRHGVRVVVDGRNCLPKEDFVRAGIIYRGVGR